MEWVSVQVPGLSLVYEAFSGTYGISSVQWAG